MNLPDLSNYLMRKLVLLTDLGKVHVTQDIFHTTLWYKDIEIKRQKDIFIQYFFPVWIESIYFLTCMFHRCLWKQKFVQKIIIDACSLKIFWNISKIFWRKNIILAKYLYRNIACKNSVREMGLKKTSYESFKCTIDLQILGHEHNPIKIYSFIDPEEGD